jgi:hypothetical protein
MIELNTSLADPQLGLLRRLQMIAIAKALSRVSGTEVGVESLKTVAIFCGVGLLVSLLLVTYGLDLSPGFF